MIKRTIRIIKPMKPGITATLPALVSVELRDTEVQLDRANAVNRWISERRKNAGVESARSRSMILAWRTKHRLRSKSKLTAAPIIPHPTHSKD